MSPELKKLVDEICELNGYDLASEYRYCILLGIHLANSQDSYEEKLNDAENSNFLEKNF